MTGTLFSWGQGFGVKMPGIQQRWWLWNIVNMLRTLDLTLFFVLKVKS